MAKYEIKDGVGIIPEGDTIIKYDAFKNRTELTSIVIPNSVKEIGESSFEGCTNLKEIVIPDSVEIIYLFAFRDCSSLTSVVIPAQIIQHYAFAGCTGLTEIVFHDSVRRIDHGAFNGCTNLTSIVIPGSVTELDGSAFEYCTNLTKISVAEGNPIYDSRDNCNAVIETATNKLIVGCSATVIPESVTAIGKSAFYGCTGLTHITIPESVEEIGRCAFEDCTGLTHITIPEGVKEIGPVFRGCTGLTHITIPKSVVEIRASFSGCTGLTHITIPEGVKEIGMSTFSGCTGLTHNTIPESVVEIGAFAFSGCTGLTHITIPEGVKKIKGYAFNNCTGLQSVTILCQINIKDSIFYRCKSIKTLTLGTGIKKFYHDFFEYMVDSLETIYVPSKKTDYYKKRIPESLHSKIVELPAENKKKLTHALRRRSNMNEEHQLLHRLYATHAPTGCEWQLICLVRDYLSANVTDAEVRMDGWGSLYVTKGKSDGGYPLLCCHLDQVQTVHSEDFEVREEDGILYGWSAGRQCREGLGADDKNGIWVCLRCLETCEQLKVFMAAGEEKGCIGSNRADMEFFADCLYALEPDCRGGKEIHTNLRGIPCASTEFEAALELERHGYTITEGKTTDLLALTLNGLGVSCANIPAGYYLPHKDEEYTIVEELEHCLDFIRHTVQTLRCRFPYEYKTETQKMIERLAM